MNILIDYVICKLFHQDNLSNLECQNKEAYYTCYKCGKCGRVFEDGILIDDGGTTEEEEDE